MRASRQAHQPLTMVSASAPRGKGAYHEVCGNGSEEGPAPKFNPESSIA